ncbi:LacI family DNA-binding transcriptional regulator [Sporosarcina sp. CAU 1771]
MRPTIYNVAKESGVSIATVSKVINNTGNMRDSTRERVKEAMKKLNYQPSMMATALTGKGTKTLGLLVPDISNPFFSEIAKTIEDRAHEFGMSIIICSTYEDLEKETKYLQLLQRQQVDGFIVASTFQDTTLLKDLKKRGFPLVMLTHDNAGLGVTSVSVDDFKGGYEATSYLISLGHTNIAIIAEHANSSSMRIYGYREAHAAHSIECFDTNIYKTSATLENAKQVFNQIIDKGDMPTAIFACNDLLAIGVIQGAKEKGLIVPEDLSLVGFDNTILATTTVPALTTMAQPIYEIGKRVVDVILKEIKENKQLDERILFNPQLIVRGTATKKEK